MFANTALPFLADGDAVQIHADGAIGDRWHAGSPRGVIERLTGEHLFDNESRELLKDTLAYIIRTGDQIRAYFWQPMAARQMVAQGIDQDIDQMVLPDAGNVYWRTMGRIDQKTGRINRI